MFFNKEKRFVVYTEAMGLGSVKILMDRVTGVHYLYFCDGCSGGLTPLLDSEGKPIVETPCECDDE